ncbi:hypothetical protein PF005_g29275 [Phytophthora fragariae]|nr:hypothetical protein PF009_g29719 [Phytophthora fragariae]KAE9064612.1 hypothetical protein PF007_g29137 [Phytophthora fragariae]KAE9166244.1 hypothetical protein PF005_g29275 [Phytophthora fragariae]KAE9172848.1 hypothetical protein PF004_g27150 [Phytophthora fragariae]
MRLLHVAAVAALALIACCDAAVADPKSSKLTSADQAAHADGNNGRFLRNRPEELDSEDPEDSEDRAAASNVRYITYYKARMTPKQVAKAIGLSLGSPQQRKELQRFYLGYYSYYSAMKRRKRRKKELEGYIYP